LPNKFQAREYRTLRALVFVALGAWGIVPVTHMTFLHWNTYAVRKAIVLDLCMGATYLVSDGTCFVMYFACCGAARCSSDYRNQQPMHWACQWLPVWAGTGTGVCGCTIFVSCQACGP
jgi:hypothetical protein